MNPLNPPLHTARLRLDWLQAEDVPFLLELLNSPGWLRWIGDRQVRDPQAARNYLEQGPQQMRRQHGFALLRVSLAGVPIGLCGLLRREHLDAPDLGFAFLPAYAGQGYAQEAAQAVLHWARQLGHDRVLAITLPDNSASIRLLERVGMQRVGLLPVDHKGDELLLLVIELAPPVTC